MKSLALLNEAYFALNWEKFIQKKSNGGYFRVKKQIKLFYLFLMVENYVKKPKVKRIH